MGDCVKRKTWCMCVYVCVYVRETDRERGKQRISVCVFVKSP